MMAMEAMPTPAAVKPSDFSVALGKVQAQQNEAAIPPSDGHKGRPCRRSASGHELTQIALSKPPSPFA